MRRPSADQPATFGWPSYEADRIFGWPPAAGKICTVPLCAQRGGLSLTSSATNFPSGEKTGSFSADSVLAKAVTLPVATSTTDTSEVVQSFAIGVFEWLKAITLPSGDQSNPPTW